VERTAALDDEAARVDLCDECDAHLDALRELIAKGESTKRQTRGRPSVKNASRPVRERGLGLPTDCREPGCGYVAPSRSALGQHVKSQHGKLLSDYNWAA
jgi:hypothetical protein